MEGFEFIKLIAMIISLISIVNLPIIFKRNKNYVKYIPGFIFLILGFTISSLDDVIFSDLFSYLEVFFFLGASISFLSACILEIKEIQLKKENIE